VNGGPAPTVCVANVTPAGRRRRLALGVVLLGVALAAAAVLVALGAPRPLRLALFVPCWLGALGLFQAWAHT
jgi:uncharacterized membrane protein (UPF0136 family)